MSTTFYNHLLYKHFKYHFYEKINKKYIEEKNKKVNISKIDIDTLIFLLSNCINLETEKVK